jgi:hypothetical protein
VEHQRTRFYSVLEFVSIERNSLFVIVWADNFTHRLVMNVSE